MISRYFKIILLLIFLSTTVLVVVIQYNAIKNIDELVEGNENLIAEFSMKNKLQRLQNEVLLIDNKVRSAVIRNKADDPALIKEQIVQVQQSVKDLGNLLVTDSSKRLWQELYYLTEEKIRFSSLILQTFSTSGKQAAEDYINTQRGIRLTEAIDKVSRQLEYARQSYLTEIVKEADENSIRAKRFGFVLAVVAITIVLMAFGFISNRIKRQQQLIEQLNESERMEREASKVKEHFIANMSHEIRTPMNAILGFTNLLKKQPLDNKSTLFVNSIHESSEKLLAIINDVLDLSKIEAGMMRIEQSQFNFPDVMYSVQTMLGGKAQEKKLKVVYDIDKKIPKQVMGDPVRITQVLVNLVSNAIKFTEKGSIRVAAKALSLTENEVLVGIQVTDSGIGIQPEKLDTIFDRFTQAEESTTRRFGGTGLGLSIVQQIVTLLEGRIWVESEPGQGSSFNVEIPLEIAEEKIIYDRSDISTEKAAAPPNIMKILVVEDNPMNQMLMEHLLEAWQYPFRIAGNGKVAVDILKEESFNMVLMDIQMPEMDGYMATQAIRSELKLSVPIIAMTAHAFEGEKEKCIRTGMDDYLAKPIREQELADLIERYSKKEGPSTNINPNKYDQNNYSKVIDLAYLREISGGSVKFERDILKQFVLQAPVELQELEYACQQENWSQVRSRAHTLKTTTSFLGLQPLLLEQLNKLENAHSANTDTLSIDNNMLEVTQICESAIAEAKSLLEEFAVVSSSNTR